MKEKVEIHMKTMKQMKALMTLLDYLTRNTRICSNEIPAKYKGIYF